MKNSRWGAGVLGILFGNGHVALYGHRQSRLLRPKGRVALRRDVCGHLSPCSGQHRDGGMKYLLLSSARIGISNGLLSRGNSLQGMVSSNSRASFAVEK